MRIIDAFLADAAHLTGEGRLNCLGGFLEVLTVNSLPVLRPLICVIIRLELAGEDMGATHIVDVRLLDPAGNPMLPSALTKLDCTGMQGIARIAIFNRATDIEFPSPGQYVFTVHIDGIEARRLPLSIQVPEVRRGRIT